LRNGLLPGVQSSDTGGTSRETQQGAGGQGGSYTATENGGLSEEGWR
jgi:hypothetical protein